MTLVGPGNDHVILARLPIPLPHLLSATCLADLAGPAISFGGFVELVLRLHFPAFLAELRAFWHILGDRRGD